MNMNFKSKAIWAHKVGFVPEVQHHQDVYVSVEVYTKDRFLSTLNLSEWPPRSIWFFTINPHTEEDNTKFFELNHNLGSSRATPSHLGGKSPRITNMKEIIDEDEQSALAQMSGSLKDLLQFSLKCSRIKREA
jgi:hypothetical protein